MTLLSVVKDVCADVGVQIPSSVFSNITGNRTMQEMVALANEMAQRIAYDGRDWQKLKRTQSYTGNGIQTAFDLPSDYKRMLLTSNIYRSSAPMTPMSFIGDTDEWINRRAMQWIDNPYGEWTILGDQLHIYPAIEAGKTAFFAYVNKNCVKLASGGYGDVFLADGDSFALDERVFKLGMIWQWKAKKGGSYSEDMGTYGDALNFVSGHDMPAPILSGYRRRGSNNVLFIPPGAS
jgi:hypothetical protein